ncbi:MAG: hypothetical protein AAB897_01895 [Patescibacteria group bacterium]
MNIILFWIYIISERAVELVRLQTYRDQLGGILNGLSNNFVILFLIVVLLYGLLFLGMHRGARKERKMLDGIRHKNFNN